MQKEGKEYSDLTVKQNKSSTERGGGAAKNSKNSKHHSGK